MNNYKRVILYGAGKHAAKRYNERTNTYHAVHALGRDEIFLKPDCFCDSNKERINSVYLDLPVYSLEQLNERYGDEFNIYISVSLKHRHEIQALLLSSGISPERIINYENFRTFKSCRYLRDELRVLNMGIAFCCQGHRKIPMELWKSVEYPYDDMIVRFEKLRKNFLDKIERGEATACDGCPELKEQNWNSNIKQFNVFGYVMTGKCQLSCSYCFYGNSKIKINDFEREIVERFDLEEFIEALFRHDLISPGYSTISFWGGEVSLLPDSYITAAVSRGYAISALTNAVKFDGRLIDARCSLNPVSVDAGTRETYHKIKGLNVFDKVWENIRIYVDAGILSSLKYVFVPENCNRKDIHGFLQKVRDSGIKSVEISSDWNKQMTFSREQIETICFAIMTLREHDIHPYLSSVFALQCPGDALKINNLLDTMSHDLSAQFSENTL